MMRKILNSMKKKMKKRMKKMIKTSHQVKMMKIKMKKMMMKMMMDLALMKKKLGKQIRICQDKHKGFRIPRKHKGFRIPRNKLQKEKSILKKQNHLKVKPNNVNNLNNQQLEEENKQKITRN